MKKVWQTGRRTDRRTERGVLRAAWSQLKMYPWLTFNEIHWAYATLRGLNERSVRVSYVFCLYLSSSWNESWMCCGARGFYLVLRWRVFSQSIKKNPLTTPVRSEPKAVKSLIAMEVPLWFIIWDQCTNILVLRELNKWLKICRCLFSANRRQFTILGHMSCAYLKPNKYQALVCR